LSDIGCLEIQGASLKARNYLAHEFYRKHADGKFTPEGRQRMLADLKSIHQIIFEAYRKVLQLSDIEIPPLEHD
ncbi:TPA: hypothetical protein ACHKAQ_005146, partial [Escherichia coli]